MLLNPNCSEAVCRILLSNLTESEINEILSLLRSIDNIHGNESLSSYKVDENKPVEDLVSYDYEFVKQVKEYWYDTTWSIEDVFGIQVIRIQGDTPYNFPDWLEKLFREKLSFGSKLKIRFSDT